MSFLAKRVQRVGMSRSLANFLLFLITMAWGLSYVLMKIGGAAIPPFEVLALRFTIASCICIAIFYRRLARLTKRAVVYGILLGTVMYGCSTSIIYGMLTTEASTASFLTSAAIVIVPVAQAIRKRRLPEPKIILGTIGTTVGIALLSLKGSLVLSPGATLCIISAFLYAAHIIMTDAMTRKEDAVLLGIVQMVVMSGWGWLTSVVFATPVMPTGARAWLAILGLAVICGAFAFVTQPFAQSYTTPEHTALIFSLEPVFGAMFGWLFLGEWLSFQATCGALLVLASVLLTTVHRPAKH